MPGPAPRHQLSPLGCVKADPGDLRAARAIAAVGVVDAAAMKATAVAGVEDAVAMRVTAEVGVAAEGMKAAAVVLAAEAVSAVVEEAVDSILPHSSRGWTPTATA